MILFVGDKPSKANLDPNVAFVGTKSYTTLLKWIADMGLDPYNVVLINRTDRYFLKTLSNYIGYGFPIITLGLKAKSDVEIFTQDFYAMPHPSGLNRQLNRKDYLDTKLLECKKFIQDRI